MSKDAGNPPIVSWLVPKLANDLDPLNLVKRAAEVVSYGLSIKVNWRVAFGSVHLYNCMRWRTKDSFIGEF